MPYEGERQTFMDAKGGGRELESVRHPIAHRRSTPICG